MVKRTKKHLVQALVLEGRGSPKQKGINIEWDIFANKRNCEVRLMLSGGDAVHFG